MNPTGMKKLCESYFGGTKLSEETVEGKKHLYIDGVMAQAEVDNKNERFYPLDVLREAIDIYKDEYVNTNRAYGELGHPLGDEINVDLNNACVLITQLEQDQSTPTNFIGRARVLEGTPKGDLLSGILRNGGNVGTSTRALGLMEQDGRLVKKCILFAIDPVWNASAPSAAIMEAILEQKEFMKNYKNSDRQKYLKECLDEIELARKEVRKINEAKKIKDFEKFLATL